MASTTYGLTDAGFVIPTFDDILANYTSALEDSFGTDVSTTEDTVFGQLFRIISYTDYTLWEGMQGVFNTQTLNGAEGIYLDDLFSKRGLTRKAASAGTGYAYVKTSSKAAWTATVPTTTYFNADNDLTYYVSTETALRTEVGAFTITKSQATSAATRLTFYMENADDGGINSLTLVTSSSTFLTDLAAFMIENLSTDDQALVLTDTTTLYMGFEATTDTDPVGLTTAVKFYASAPVGYKWSLIPVEASETGKNAVAIGGITGISSTFTGYEDTGNFTAFSAGTDVETDAEYRSRFNDNQDEANAATRPAIVSAISELDGVTKVRIYDNPTATATTYVPAFTFNTVVYGGDATEIADALYKSKPINTLTSGTTSTTISTEDGGTETIKFTAGITSEYSLKLVYQTASEKELTTSEKSAIVTAIEDLEAYFEIGTSISNGQIKGVIYGALDFGRLTSLNVYVKLSTEDDTSYSESDVSPAYNSLPSLDTDDISYEYGT